MKEFYRDIFLDAVFEKLWQNTDPFAEVEKIEGEEAPTGWSSNIINTQVKIEFGYNK